MLRTCLQVPQTRPRKWPVPDPKAFPLAPKHQTSLCRSSLETKPGPSAAGTAPKGPSLLKQDVGGKVRAAISLLISHPSPLKPRSSTGSLEAATAQQHSPTSAHKSGSQRASRWCVLACVCADLSCSWRQSCSGCTYVAGGWHAGPCGSGDRERRARSGPSSSTPPVPRAAPPRVLTRTSGQRAAVNGQSGHLKVLGPMWALL